MNRIDQTFKKNEKLLSIYFSAGHPELEDTLPILVALQDSGVDMVEIGLPFSDPLADGPTIQKSSTCALRNGMTTEKLFDQLENIRDNIHIPLVLMGYLNPIMQYGIERFCQKCQSIGIDGLIIPDLPIDLYHEYYKEVFDKYNLYSMFLITPQTPKPEFTSLTVFQMVLFIWLAVPVSLAPKTLLERYKKIILNALQI